ncbi:SDR family NAD(P)-dependent oxidoreductase [Paraburkholderia fungorum]|uniref:SDR family NAD(P)-dependent oxidoreductase n=1 Tax=Paraburkholderia fungorum TaxID=134537 RepID=UPI0038BB3500
MIGITKTASIEWFRRGVRVNALCPGLIETPFHHRGIWPSVEVRHAFAASTPAGRFGSAEEMAPVVAFLASEDSSYVSGHALLAEPAIPSPEGSSAARGSFIFKRSS